MPTVTIIDYGRSNLLSVQRALEFCGAQVAFASDPQQVLEAEALVLPGVGSFADGMSMLRQRGLEKAILAKAEQGTPLLGICLGMQMLLDSSPEGGFTKGLGLIAGPVLPLESADVQGQPLRVPHVGWGGLFCAGERSDFSGSPLAESYRISDLEARDSNAVGDTFTLTVAEAGYMVAFATDEVKIWYSGYSSYPTDAEFAHISSMSENYLLYLITVTNGGLSAALDLQIRYPNYIKNPEEEYGKVQRLEFTTTNWGSSQDSDGYYTLTLSVTGRVPVGPPYRRDSSGKYESINATVFFTDSSIEVLSKTTFDGCILAARI